MKKIYLCLEKQHNRMCLSEALIGLGYEVSYGGLAVDQETSDSIIIADAYHLEKESFCIDYPIFFCDQMNAETVDKVLLHSCSGAIDSTYAGYQLRNTIELCMIYRQERCLLLKENKKLNKKLQDRRIIEKAKFLLMKRLRTSEEEAYRRMRSEAMRQQKALREVADLILLNEE